MGAHSLPTPDTRGKSRATTTLTAVMIAVGALIVLTVIVLWPRGDTPELNVPPADYVDATIVEADPDIGSCPALDEGRPEMEVGCTIFGAELTAGDDTGSVVPLMVTDTMVEIPDLEIGDRIVLRHNPTAIPEFEYTYEDYQRSTPLLWLAVVFVVAVIAFGRWQGLRALAGLGLSLLVLVLFIVPALLQQQPALPVALAGAAVVAYLAIYLAHGRSVTSSIALAGTLVSLAVTTVGAVIVASLTQLSGLSGEEAQVLNVTVEALDLRGLLVAGIVIGSLGVLDDVTVSQVSTVAALRRANDELTVRQLYSEAIRVGRDHVAAAVNTLVLAYAGASLPLLLFFVQSGNQPVSRLLTSEIVAVSIVRMLVGSIGLILSVPVTTGLAALILARSEPLPDDHGHSHGHVHGDLPVPHDGQATRAGTRGHDAADDHAHVAGHLAAGTGVAPGRPPGPDTPATPNAPPPPPPGRPTGEEPEPWF